MDRGSKCDNWEGLIDFILIVILLIGWLCLKHFKIL